MLKHVVMFRFKEDKEATAEELKRRLLALPPQIDVIKGFEVGINLVASARAYDLVLISDFESLKDMQAYQVHPAHQEVGKYTSQVSESIVAVDYEY
ncbi:Dabb family protein [Phototrophicus methaneseepsis]|uniref:Dabb family protein n=1 Tax=Phototrophicus methaneseepsis TaxID=2710758 RepID=A0A7S8E5C0_9CHLR|nr:Dabb family protein [Phototrophicus methaneseepsis]QPC80661.1 Dabb family protein [Phototrophicus methaneseepsis]